MTLNDLDWLFRAKICFRAGLAAWHRANSESNCVKTNKDRHIQSAAQISGMDSSFWRYKVCADIRSGSLERDVKGQWGRSRVNARRPICGYISETVTVRGIFIIEDEYKVVCALSNSAAVDDLQRPRTPVSRSQYSLNANISQTVHPIHFMFGSRVGFSGKADRMVLFPIRQNPRWRLTAILDIQKWP